MKIDRRTALKTIAASAMVSPCLANGSITEEKLNFKDFCNKHLAGDPILDEFNLSDEKYYHTESNLDQSIDNNTWINCFYPQKQYPLLNEFLCAYYHYIIYTEKFESIYLFNRIDHPYHIFKNNNMNINSTVTGGYCNVGYDIKDVDLNKTIKYYAQQATKSNSLVLYDISTKLSYERLKMIRPIFKESPNITIRVFSDWNNYWDYYHGHK